ncbi:DUF7507 domain-containing protein, partial [Winogradskyella sp.]|uniref:DUF7507 domain-containing protein n=1 Tax=Winogradskyella sp. TaxID=1883156 RepID=UPI003AB368BF
MKISTRFSFTKNINTSLYMCMVLAKLSLFRLKTFFLVGFFSSFLIMNAQEDVTTIYGDQGGFFVSSTGATVTATDSNNLLGFIADGVTYSTGVDDSVLTSNGIVFTPANFRAFPIPGVINYSNPELLGVAYNWGGVNQTNTPSDYINNFSPIVPTNFVRDGASGLEMSTNFFNIDPQDIGYDDLTVLSVANITDNIPDIIVNQTGAPGGSDTFKFVDNLGNTVGNVVVVDFSSTPVVAGVDWTIYNVDPSTGSVVSTFGVNTYRDFRVLSFLLSDFGITAGNSSQIVKFVHTTSGNTDIAFTAYNTNSLGFSTAVDLSIDASVASSTSLCTTTDVDLVATVTNNSANNSYSFVVESPLPSGVSYTSSSAVFSSGSGTASYDSVLNEWVIFGLQAGESVILTVNGAASPTLPIVYNTSITNMAQSDPDYSNNSFTVSETDSDCDGVYDSLDLDSDNDGILNAVEDENLDLDNDPSTNPTDTDNDTIPDYLDLDSDNDGCFDAIEAGHIATVSGEVVGVGYDVNGQVTGYTTAYTGTNNNIITATQVVVDLAPANQTIVEGVTTTFSVVANGTSTTVYSGTAPNTVPDYNAVSATNTTSGINYQWQVDEGSGFVNLTDNTVYSGTNTSYLTISNATVSQSGNIYRVLLSHDDNNCINETRDATLTVTAYVDPCDPLASGNLDSDNDGISDECDLDDDNDGILDTDEGCGNLVVNGSFEQQNFTDDTIFPNGFTSAVGTFIGTNYNTNSLLGWDYTQNLDGWVGNSPYGGSANFVAAYHGNQFIDIVGSNNVTPGNISNVLSQVIKTVPGVTYKFSFYWGEDIGHSAGSTVTLEVDVYDVNGSLIDETLTATADGLVNGLIGPKNWRLYEQTFVATTSQTTIAFSAQHFGSNYGAGADLDYVRVESLSGCLDTDNDGVPDALDLDSDNDGIYDVDEAGNGELDTNNDGVIDSSDAVYNDDNGNGIDDVAEVNIPIDTLGDGSFDFQNTDSDGDGCSDANEAYGDADASGSDNGQFGDPDPASVNAINGLVTETGVDYSLGTNFAVTDPINTSACNPCPDTIPPGNPTAAIAAADVTFDIDSGLSAGFPAVLNSITIAGEPNAFTAIYKPNNVNYQYANPAGNSQYVRDQLSTTATIADGEEIYNAALLAANAENDLRHYVSMDNTIDPTDYNEYIYNSPIASASNRYIIVTERNGNNELSIQALDNSLNPTGNIVLANATNYIDTGVATDFTQHVFLAIYPLTALVPSGTDVQGIRITQSGATAGDGGDGKAFIVYDPSFLVLPPTIEYTTSAVQPDCVSVQGSISIDALDNGGGAMEYSVNGLAGPFQSSPNFSNLAPGSYTVAVRYISSPSCVEVALSPIVLDVPDICDIVSSNESACSDNGTPLITTDDTFTADITVFFYNPPATGNLELTGDATRTVPVTSLTAPSYTFTGVELPANGTNLSFTATFSADTNRTLTVNDVVTAPFECSDESCYDIIPVGNPSAALLSSEVSFNISSAPNAGFPAVLNSITVAGQPNPFTEIYIPNNVNYQYANPQATSQFVTDQLGTTATIADDPAIYNAALLAANFENDLRHYVSMDNTIDPTDFNEFIYNTPIAAASNRYLVITERNGNNEMSIQALDGSLNLIGNIVLANPSVYINTGVPTDYTQEIYVAIYPLTALVPSGTDVQGIRVTQTGAADPGPNFGDGGDGKAFIIYDNAFLTPPPTINLATTVVQPTCATNTGSINVGATDNGGGAIEYSVNGLAGPFLPTPNFSGLAAGSYTVAVRYAGNPDCVEVALEPIVLVEANCSISLIKSVSSVDALGAAGILDDEITYEFTVTNTGDETLTNIIVTDPLVGTVTCVSTTLAPGANTTCSATYVITQSDIDNGGIENSAIVSAEAPGGDTLDPSDDITDVSDTGTASDGTVVTDPETVETDDIDTINGDSNDSDPTNDVTPFEISQNPELTVTKTITTSGAVLNDVIVYDIIVVNTGDVTITDIEITDANADLGTLSYQGGLTNIPSLAPNASATVTVEQTITQADIDAGFVENSATAIGDSPYGTDDVTDVSDTDVDPNGDPILDNETVDGPDTGTNPTEDPTRTDLDQSPELSITKTGSLDLGADNAVSVGDIITYTYTVTNTGDVTVYDV